MGLDYYAWKHGRLSNPNAIDMTNYQNLLNCKELVQSYGFYFSNLPSGYREYISRCQLEIERLAGKMSVRFILSSKDWITFRSDYQGCHVELHRCYLSDLTPSQAYLLIEKVCRGLMRIIRNQNSTSESSFGIAGTTIYAVKFGNQKPVDKVVELFTDLTKAKKYLEEKNKNREDEILQYYISPNTIFIPGSN